MTTKRPEVDLRLLDNETVLRKINPTRKSQLLWYITGVLLLAFIIGIFILIYVEFGIVRGNRFYITKKRIIHQYKFLSKSSSTVKYSQITDIHYTQGIFGRLLNYGEIHVNTAGTTFMELVLFGIENPEEVEEQIEKLWHKKSNR